MRRLMLTPVLLTPVRQGIFLSQPQNQLTFSVCRLLSFYDVRRTAPGRLQSHAVTSVCALKGPSIRSRTIINLIQGKHSARQFHPPRTEMKCGGHLKTPTCRNEVTWCLTPSTVISRRSRLRKEKKKNETQRYYRHKRGNAEEGEEGGFKIKMVYLT